MMFENIWLVPLFPFLGFLLNGLFGSKFSEKQAGIVGSGAVILSFLAAGAISYQLLSLPEASRAVTQTVYTWIETGAFRVDLSFTVDALSAIMLLVVSGVGTLIHIYSIGYMHGDRGFARYFAFLNLFTFSMLILVLADNFLLMFLGWEGVGLCSYLLIGFWYEDKDNAFAGRKAFVVNRVGDFGFLLGICLIFATFGTLDFDSVFASASDVLPPETATIICLLLFVGAIGKSAQIPLYVWLPDAMAGPTPVSALIHAATMVTAGVYMVARCHVLFLLSPMAMNVVAVIGLFTAFLAATIALVSTDIKKVLAYSTISQLGYMFLACGVGAFGAGIFHLYTHAFFKSLLFMSAGSVMHALQNETDMTKMGGLKSKLPVTYRVFLVGALALSGVPLFSGFFSKDAILWKSVVSPLGGFGYWVIATGIAGLTAFYTFRLIFLIFFGRSRVQKEVEKHIHESPVIMTAPLGILALFSLAGGYVGMPHFWDKFDHFLQPVFSKYIENNLFERSEQLFGLEFGFMATSTLVVLLGIGCAYMLYVVRPELPAELSQQFAGLHRFLFRKWYVDELYDTTVVRPLAVVSDKVLWRWVDVKIIDGFVNKVAEWAGRLGATLRLMETGLVQNYALMVVVGAVALVGYFLLR